jgi:transposase InsO family protein
MRGMEMLFELFVVTMAMNLKTLDSKPFCCDLGLEHQFSSPYVACQNGVVERKNRSLCEMARTMLDDHRTSRRYLAEAVNTVCHVGNRIFLRAFLNI